MVCAEEYFSFFRKQYGTSIKIKIISLALISGVGGCAALLRVITSSHLRHIHYARV